MKYTVLLLLFTGALLVTGCEKDLYPLELEYFEANWADLDQSGTRSIGDKINVSAQINTTDPDNDDQKVVQWELSYFVNGDFVEAILWNDDESSNGVGISADIYIDNLEDAQHHGLQHNDLIEFRLWARDSEGTELEHFYSTRLE